MDKDEKIALVRKKIGAFEDLMLERMERHIDKPHWTNQKPAYLLVKAMENLGEISRTLTESGSKIQIAYAAADVANFVMMLTDVTFGLTSDSKSPNIDSEDKNESNNNED